MEASEEVEEDSGEEEVKQESDVEMIVFDSEEEDRVGEGGEEKNNDAAYSLDHRAWIAPEQIADVWQRELLLELGRFAVRIEDRTAELDADAERLEQLRARRADRLEHAARVARPVRGVGERHGRADLVGVHRRCGEVDVWVAVIDAVFASSSEPI